MSCAQSWLHSKHTGIRFVANFSSEIDLVEAIPSMRARSTTVQLDHSRGHVSVHIRFQTTQLQSTAKRVVAELRVYKKSIPSRAIARMRVDGCNSSDVIVGLKAVSGEVISRLALSARDLAASIWVPFRNLNEEYVNWALNKSEQEMFFKMTILSRSCNSADAVLNAFARRSSEEDHFPVLLLFSNDSTTVLQARNVNSRGPQRLAVANDGLAVLRRDAARASQGACRLQYHHVSNCA